LRKGSLLLVDKLSSFAQSGLTPTSRSIKCRHCGFKQRVDIVLSVGVDVIFNIDAILIFSVVSADILMSIFFLNVVVIIVLSVGSVVIFKHLRPLSFSRRH
jgi:hypothetical protein